MGALLALVRGRRCNLPSLRARRPDLGDGGGGRSGNRSHVRDVHFCDFVVKMLLMRLTTELAAALSPGGKSPLLGFALGVAILLSHAAAAAGALLLQEGQVALLLLDSRYLLGRRLPLVPQLFPRHD